MISFVVVGCIITFCFVICFLSIGFALSKIDTVLERLARQESRTNILEENINELETKLTKVFRTMTPEQSQRVKGLT